MTMSWCRERLFHQLQHIPAPCCGGGGSILGYVSHFPEHTIWKRCRMNVCLHISTGHSWITNTWPTDVGPCFKSDIVVHKRNSIWLCFWCFYVRLVKVFFISSGELHFSDCISGIFQKEASVGWKKATKKTATTERSFTLVYCEKQMSVLTSHFFTLRFFSREEQKPLGN